jgi:hypothetical protein
MNKLKFENDVSTSFVINYIDIASFSFGTSKRLTNINFNTADTYIRIDVRLYREAQKPYTGRRVNCFSFFYAHTIV